MISSIFLALIAFTPVLTSAQLTLPAAGKVYIGAWLDTADPSSTQI
jgi:hypothetical protein